MALVTCNQLTQALAGLLAQLNNETMWVQGGRLYLQQGDGRTINVDMVPGLLPLLETMNVCNVWMQGDDMHTQDRKYTSTDVLATCNGLYRVWEQLSDRIDNLPVDRFVSGMHSYNPATKVLTLIMSDDTVVDIPLTDLIGDILDSIQLQLRDCNGDPLEQDAQVPTCAQMNAALVTLETTLTEALNDGMDSITAALDGYQLKLRDANGNALPGGTQVYSTTETNSAINAAVAAAVANLQARLRDCNSALIPLDTPIPTCAQMNVAIGNALASLPTEVHVVSGAYNATTDALVLTMNTGPVVSIPLTALINDAVAATQAAVQYATIAEVVSGTGGAKTVAPGVAKQRTDIAVFGSGAAANRPSPTAYKGVAIGYNAAAANTGDSSDTVVGRSAFEAYDSAVQTVASGSNTVLGNAALPQFTNAATPTEPGGVVAVGMQTGLNVVGGARSVLIGNGAGGSPTASDTTLIDTVALGANAGRYGRRSVVLAQTAVGDVAVGAYAGHRQKAPTSNADASVYIGFGAGQTAYAQSPQHRNVFVGGSAGAQSMGGDCVAVGAQSYQGGLGYSVTALGRGAGRNNVSSHCSYLGAETRGTSSVLATTTVDTTAAIQYDDTGAHVELPAASLMLGHPYVLKFFTAPAAGGAQMSGAYTGIAQTTTRLRIPVWSVSSPPGAVPYDAGAIQSVQLQRLSFYNNSTAIGFDTLLQDSDTVYLGNAATQAVRSTGTFYSAGVALTSDERLKSAISDLDMPAARAFVKGLRFVEYAKHANYIAVRAQLEAHLALAISDKDEAAIAYRQAALDAFDENEVKGPGRREAGLIAQEVKTLAEQHGFGYVVSEDTNGVLSLDYNSIQAIINAVVIDALEL